MLGGVGRLDAAEFTSALDAVAVKLDVTREEVQGPGRAARTAALAACNDLAALACVATAGGTLDRTASWGPTPGWKY